jgi:hypothetical protein
MMSEMKPVKLAEMDWPWKSENPGVHIILISDKQFVNMANHPDEAMEKMYPWADAPISLRDYCKEGAERGATTLRIAYDYFFGGSQRSLYPDTEVFQDTLKKISDVAQEFGIGLEPSILSPLELGMGYSAKTGESGRWMHYREGLRDPQTGAFSVEMWEHQQWCNNKGPTPVKLVGVRAFAFHEERIIDTPFFAVNPDEIVELETPAYVEIPGIRADTPNQFKAVRIRVFSTPAGQTAQQEISQASTPAGEEQGFVITQSTEASKPGELNRVLVVLLYQTVEMDYLSPSAPAFLSDMVEQYHARGIALNGLYSDESHIQQDWSYHAHMDNGQFAMRYVSIGFERAFAEKFGKHYADFGRYMVYFACHQHDFLPTHEPKLPSQHVFGTSREDIFQTLLFRRNYFNFLESSVVGLMVAARQKAEQLYGHVLDAYYHSTWAESPTCDAASNGGVHREWSPEEHRRKYEYTPEFVWSNTVHQASAACANQFAWNEFLSGGNDDTPEGGYADRNYYGRTLACSLAALNRSPLASAGMWGMPGPVSERMLAVSQVFGALGHSVFRSVEDYATRKIEVLFVYPQDLVAVEERFGSWMVQYGYANLITAEKLVQYGQVAGNGRLAVKGSQYRAVCVLYEPFPGDGLFALLKDFAHQGGSVVWSSIPPLLDLEGKTVGQAWMEDLFGVSLIEAPDPLGLSLPARQVVFTGELDGVAAMPILTDFVVDRVFPVKLLEKTETVATLRPGGGAPALTVGTLKSYPGGGQAIYLGFRPRDDQAASTGSEARTWYEILYALEAYPDSGVFEDNDNPTVISRSTRYLACSFPNGTTAVAPHYREQEENWPGGFFRKEEDDQRIMETDPPPSDAIDLHEFHIAGQTVSYQGRHAVAWRTGVGGGLAAFAGVDCSGMVLDGQSIQWSDQPVEIGWHPLQAGQNTPGYTPLYRVWCGTQARVRIPLNLIDHPALEVWLGAYEPGITRRRRKESFGRAGYGLKPVEFKETGGWLVLDVNEDLAGHWLYVVLRGGHG